VITSSVSRLPFIVNRPQHPSVSRLPFIVNRPQHPSVSRLPFIVNRPQHPSVSRLPFIVNRPQHPSVSRLPFIVNRPQHPSHFLPVGRKGGQVAVPSPIDAHKAIGRLEILGELHGIPERHDAIARTL
jgi:hypothetical protein